MLEPAPGSAPVLSTSRAACGRGSSASPQPEPNLRARGATTEQNFVDSCVPAKTTTDPRKDGLFEKIRIKTIHAKGLHTSSGQVTVKVWLPETEEKVTRGQESPLRRPVLNLSLDSHTQRRSEGRVASMHAPSGAPHGQSCKHLRRCAPGKQGGLSRRGDARAQSWRSRDSPRLCAPAPRALTGVPPVSPAPSRCGLGAAEKQVRHPARVCSPSAGRPPLHCGPSTGGPWSTSSSSTPLSASASSSCHLL